MDIERREYEVMLGELAVRAETCGIAEHELEIIVGTWPVDIAAGDVRTEKVARRLYELLGLTRWLFGEDARIWLQRPNGILDDEVPMHLLLTDPAAVVGLRDILRMEVDAC